MAVVLITLDHHSRQLGVAHTERVVKQYIVREEEAIVRGHRIIAGKVQGALGLKRDDDDDDGAAREMPEEHAVDDFDDDDDDDAGDDDAARGRRRRRRRAKGRARRRRRRRGAAGGPRGRRGLKRPGGAAADRPPSFEEFLEQEGVDRDVPPNRAVPLVERPEPNREPPAGVVDHGILFTTTRRSPERRGHARASTRRGGGSCEADFGNGLIDRWRDARKTYCAPRSDGSDPRAASHRLLPPDADGPRGPRRQPVRGDERAPQLRGLCRRRDGDEAVRALRRREARGVEAHVSYREARAAGLRRGSRAWRTEHFPGWNAHWADAFARVDDLECDVWEDAPTLVVERDTFANLFHDSEDFVNAFIALAVLRWSTADLQILLTDIYPEGPFWDMWSRVAIGILGAAAPTTLHTSNTRCKASSVVRAYSDFVIRGLGLQGAARYAAPDGDPKDVVVTFLARRSSSEWPEKRFCDSETSFFDCAKLQHLGVRGLGRTIKNDAEVVRALKSLETRSFANGARVRFRDVDYNLLSFEDQIKVDLDTDVMGRAYTGGPMANPVPVDRLLAVVAAAVAGLDLSKPY
ncbi:hypothetical protein JL722_2033 [Aureococcus anophagefferens]|nr:hypothetical protein JL722_2033 [Aureococcus anophagefferens]